MPSFQALLAAATTTLATEVECIMAVSSRPAQADWFSPESAAAMATPTAIAGRTIISAGVLEAAPGIIPAQSCIQLDGGVFQSSGSFARRLVLQLVHQHHHVEQRWFCRQRRQIDRQHRWATAATVAWTGNGHNGIAGTMILSSSSATERGRDPKPPRSHRRRTGHPGRRQSQLQRRLRHALRRHQRLGRRRLFDEDGARHTLYKGRSVEHLRRQRPTSPAAPSIWPRPAAPSPSPGTSRSASRATEEATPSASTATTRSLPPAS